MKRIELKETTIKKDEKENITYKDLLNMCVNKPPQGFTVEEMRKRLRLVDVLSKAELVVDMEDADYTHMKKLVSDMDGSWAIAHKDIIDFVDYINSIT